MLKVSLEGRSEQACADAVVLSGERLWLSEGPRADAVVGCFARAGARSWEIHWELAAEDDLCVPAIVIDDEEGLPLQLQAGDHVVAELPLAVLRYRGRHATLLAAEGLIDGQPIGLGEPLAFHTPSGWQLAGGDPAAVELEIAPAYYFLAAPLARDARARLSDLAESSSLSQRLVRRSAR